MKTIKSVILLISFIFLTVTLYAREPVVPNASPEAKALLNFIHDVYGKKTMSGQMWAPWGNFDEIDKIMEITGKYPAVRGHDLIHERSNADEVKRLIDWWQKGGIPTLMWHWGAPTKGEGYEQSKMKIDIENCFKEGTEEYKAMWDDLKRIADWLTVLRDAKVPVLWRPMHEFEGGWFWYGKGTGEQFNKLWQTMFNYFTKDRKLNNLIWVLCHSDFPNPNFDPGNQYYDIVGADTYKKDRVLKEMFDDLIKVHGKELPIVMHECGPIPDPETSIKDGSVWSWWMVWHTSWVTQHDPAELKRIYNHESVLTLDKLPDIMSYSK